jgi:hypothetical protein
MYNAEVREGEEAGEEGRESTGPRHSLAQGQKSV